MQLLADYLIELHKRNKAVDAFTVYSVTNSDGFKISEEYFSKKVFSKELNNYKIVKKGDFAFNPSRINVGSIDFFDTYDEFGLVSPLYVTFTTKTGLDRRYLKYYLKSDIGIFFIRNNTRGAVRDTLYFKDLCRIKIPVPPLSEQERIVEILDTADRMRQKRREQIKLLDDYLKSVFLHMFGDPILNEKGWRQFHVKEVALVKIGPFGSLLHKGDYIKNGIPLVNPSHIIDNKIAADFNNSITPEKHKELFAYHLKEMDIILARRGEIGRCGIVTSKEESYLCGTGSMYIRPKKMLNSLFVVFLLSSPQIKAFLENNAIGITMKNLNAGIIKELSIPVPQIELQNKFASIVNQVEAMKRKMRESLDEMDTHFNALMHQFFG